MVVWVGISMVTLLSLLKLPLSFNMTYGDGVRNEE